MTNARRPRRSTRHEPLGFSELFDLVLPAYNFRWHRPERADDREASYWLHRSEVIGQMVEGRRPPASIVEFDRDPALVEQCLRNYRQMLADELTREIDRPEEVTYRDPIEEAEIRERLATVADAIASHAADPGRTVLELLGGADRMEFVDEGRSMERYEKACERGETGPTYYTTADWRCGSMEQARRAYLASGVCTSCQERRHHHDKARKGCACNCST